MASKRFVKSLVILIFILGSLEGQSIRAYQSRCYEEQPNMLSSDSEVWDTDEGSQPKPNYRNDLTLHALKSDRDIPAKRGNTMSLIDVLDFVTKSKAKAKTQAKTQNIFIPKRPVKQMKWKSVVVMVLDCE